ncbi:cupin domain-containing protein, partial [Mycobacterium tuberculosis]|nr:cupin domain-containing protein [Mycobacterium tuberculosis]
WVLSKPVAGGAVTFSQTILEVQPGGGSQAPEPQPEVEGFLFVMAGELTVTHEGTDHVLTPGGFAYLPAGSTWSAQSTGAEAARFHWVR